MDCASSNLNSENLKASCYDKSLVWVFESIEVNVSYSQETVCQFSELFSFSLRAQTEYKRHRWVVNKTHDDLQAMINALVVAHDKTWSPEMTEVVFWAKSKICSVFRCYKSKNSNIQYEENKVYAGWSRNLGEIAKRLISACKTEKLAKFVFPFFDIFPLAIKLGWLTGFESNYGAVSKDFFGLKENCVSPTSIVSFTSLLFKSPPTFVSNKAHLQNGSSESKCWYFVGPLYIAFVFKFESGDVEDVFYACEGLFSKCVDIKLGDYSGHIEPKLYLKNKQEGVSLTFESQAARNDCAQAIKEMINRFKWTKKNRYGSFAPIRSSNYCKAYVDACDYFCALSQAIRNAQKCIFIQTNLFSSQVFLRRSAKGNGKYRLDNLLQEKASEGVKIYILVTRSPIDDPEDLYKPSFNIETINCSVICEIQPMEEFNEMEHQQRENFVIIDYDLAFFGETSLCFGRYDTPEHQIFDRNKFSEGAISTSFGNSDGLEESLYMLGSYTTYCPFKNGKGDARMPWHDIQLKVFGPVARDLCRVFAQKWYYFRSFFLCILFFVGIPCDLQEKTWKTVFAEQDLDRHLECECQLLPSMVDQNFFFSDRKRTSCIQNAFCSLIQNSKYHVYIEDEFIVTFKQKNGDWKSNKLGDTLYKRIMKAHKKKQNWKAIILVPLRPVKTFEETHDQFETRKMMSTRYSASSKARHSIITRLKASGVNPSNYIQFYSLRTWGVSEPHAFLATSQIYTHSKVMIVDDRKCIFGSTRVSANIVEGGIDDNDAFFVQDKEMVKSRMDGKDYDAGVFASGLRQKLMREHLGCDLDLVNYVEETFAHYRAYAKQNYSELHTIGDCGCATLREQCINSSVVELAMREIFDLGSTAAWHRVHGKKAPRSSKVHNVFTKNHRYTKLLNFSFSPYLEQFVAYMDTLNSNHFKQLNLLKSLLYLQHKTLGKGFISPFSDLGSNSLENFVSSMYGLANLVDPFSFVDPLDETFCNIWHATASRNTAIYRCVFYCQPDEYVLTKNEEKLFARYEELFFCYQKELASNPLLEASFDPVDQFIASRTNNKECRKALGSLGALSTKNKIARRKRIAKELLQTVIGHLVLLPSPHLEQEEKLEGKRLARFFKRFF